MGKREAKKRKGKATTAREDSALFTLIAVQEGPLTSFVDSSLLTRAWIYM